MRASITCGCPSLRPVLKNSCSSIPLLRFQRKPSSGIAPRRSPLRVQNLSCKEIGTIVCSTLLSGILILGPPAMAQVKTVPANEVSALAKPLQAEKVEKKRVWLVFVAGAASLFVFINIIENNPSWFPAVTRANKAMSMRRKQRFKQAEITKLEEAEAEALRLTKSVEEGLAKARKQRWAQTAREKDQTRPSEFKNGQESSEFMTQRDATQNQS